MTIGAFAGSARPIVTAEMFNPQPIAQSVAAKAPVLTPAVLAAYIARQQALKGFNVFQETAAAGHTELTSALVSAYAARDNDPANAALRAIDRAAASTPPFGLTDSMVAAYAKDRFVPTLKKIAHANKEQLCLTKAIYYEARGESVDGQWAVANVIINRAMDDQFPSTMCGVVFQNANAGRNRCQFSFACDGRPDIGTERKAWRKAHAIADAAYADFQRGKRPNVVPRSTLYYHTLAVDPSWSNSYREVAEIGHHVFYAPM